MQQIITIRLPADKASREAEILSAISQKSGCRLREITGYQLLKKSIDARGKAVWINLTVRAVCGEPYQVETPWQPRFRQVGNAEKTAVIIGSGPAGLFAALELINLGIRPIILERGKAVRERRRDLAALNRKGEINPDSNYCFGEGGAGTYSDGKLYTRSNKRGNVMDILRLFVHFGAHENILYETHPHIGTNKLPQIITAMHKCIIDCGGQFHFNKRVVDLVLEKDRILSAKTLDGDRVRADAFILATGHSARDIFELLDRKKIAIQAKPFALGVRVEHPQELINLIQYGPDYPVELPPASYSLVTQVNQRGVFSFCMCPGGIIAPASTQQEELVVNGWSPSRRNNPFANSGMVVQVEPEDVVAYYRSTGTLAKHQNGDSSLFMMEFQSEVERIAFAAGGGNFVAPAQRMTDFVKGISSSSLPSCSYPPGVRSAALDQVLPRFISQRLKEAFPVFGKKLSTRTSHGGYFTEEAILVATESRTSSPVRIPRLEDRLHHPQISNLYPCGEGAGYAGGIVSAAMDGQRIARALHVRLG